MMPTLLFLCAVVMSGGCASTAPTTTPVDPNVLRAVLAWFVFQKGLNFVRRGAAGRRLAEADKHKGFFIWRRARWIGERNASWVAEADQPRLKARIDSEYTALEAYVSAKLGAVGAPGPLLTGAGDPAPTHLDLADMARFKEAHGAVTVAGALAARAHPNRLQARVLDGITARRQRAMAIVWRAAAIHDQLWNPGPGGTTATLRSAAMDEILDRRLRACERMHHQISTASEMGGRSWDRGGGARPHGPWTDTLRLRIFEYPRVDADAAFIQAVGGPGNIGPGREWLRSGDELDWAQGTRVAPPPAPHFPNSVSAPYYRDVWPAGGTTPAAAIDLLFQSSGDWWQRSWLYCDHVLAALHVEALLFGKRRRPGAGAGAFNSIVTGRPRGYVLLGPLVPSWGGYDGDRLMADDADPHFENAEFSVADLQVGDQLIFWNNILYPLVSGGAWQLENAVVMGVGSQPDGGATDLAGLRLQGHGTRESPIAGYEQIVARLLARAVTQAQNEVSRPAHATDTFVAWRDDGQRLVRWSPYPADTWAAPGPWWVRVPARDGLSLSQTRDLLRKGVLDVPRAGGYVPPPGGGNFVYFPLFEPHLPGGWDTYMNRRPSGPLAGLRQRLRRTPIDGTIVPGLHFRGTAPDPIPGVRPKVEP